MPKAVRRKKRGGRKPAQTLLTRQRHEMIVAEYEQTRNFTFAAAAGGICIATLSEWRNRGTLAIEAVAPAVWAEACTLRSERTKADKPRRAWWDAVERKLGMELDPHACLVWDLEQAGIAFGRANLAAVKGFRDGVPKRDKQGRPVKGTYLKKPDLRAATWMLEHCMPEIYGSGPSRHRGTADAHPDPREYAAAVAEFVHEVNASIAGPPKDEV